MQNYDATVVVDAHIDRALEIMMIPETIVVIDITTNAPSRCRHRPLRIFAEHIAYDA